VLTRGSPREEQQAEEPGDQGHRGGRQRADEQADRDQGHDGAVAGEAPPLRGLGMPDDRDEVDAVGGGHRAVPVLQDVLDDVVAELRVDLDPDAG
jgi:hypothetical protein